MGVDNFLSAVLEMPVIVTVQKILNLPKFISQFLDSVLVNRGLIIRMVATVKSKKRKQVTKEANMDDKCPQFLTFGQR